MQSPIKEAPKQKGKGSKKIKSYIEKVMEEKGVEEEEDAPDDEL